MFFKVQHYTDTYIIARVGFEVLDNSFQSLDLLGAVAVGPRDRTSCVQSVHGALGLRLDVVHDAGGGVGGVVGLVASLGRVVERRDIRPQDLKVDVIAEVRRVERDVAPGAAVYFLLGRHVGLKMISAICNSIGFLIDASLSHLVFIVKIQLDSPNCSDIEQEMQLKKSKS